MTETIQVYKLENWFITMIFGYTDPEINHQYLRGNVYGNPKFADGESIITPPIAGRKGKYIQTYSGSLYELGVVDSEYEKLFPNAYERLMKSMPEVEEDDVCN